MTYPMTPKSSDKVKCNELSSPFLVPPTPLLHKVGYGTGASVYRLDRSPRCGIERSPWALKKINRKLERGTFVKERLIKEADILQNLNHPNIVGFRGFTKTEDGREVLIMEECTQSLGDIIEYFNDKEIRCISPNLVFKVVSDVCKALHYLHTDVKLIHGDIKSFNILIKDNFESAKLCDFGVSIPVDNDGVSEEEYTGTYCWTPLEVVTEGPVTIKADIFALGLTIYEMLALEPPIINEDEDEEMFGKRRPLPDYLGPEYSAVIELYNWCTEEDYKKRPTAKDILDYLDKM